MPPLVALAVGLMDGLGTSRLRGYREAGIEALTMAGLIGIGLLPVMGVISAIACLVVAPPTVLLAGALTAGPEARFARPPALLVIASLAAFAVVMYLIAAEYMQAGVPLGDALGSGAVGAGISLIAVPAVVLLAARAGAVWLQPRLQVYQQLTEYLRVMWIPIGGFAIGYVAVIVVFAGFSGMLARFSPRAFAGAEDAGIGDWIAFAFFWALVVFAAVMSSIQPRLDRIAR